MLEQERVDKGSNKPVVELSSIELTPPSRCVDYPASAQGPFRVRPPRVKEVEFMASMNAMNYDKQLTDLLRSLILSPSSVDPLDLTIGDRQYLHLWVRAQIDPTYVFETTCPKCGEVDKKFELIVNDIPLVEVSSKYHPNMSFTLPRSGKKVTVRLETGRDREIRTKLEDKDITKWVSRIACVITSVDGESMEVEDRCEWVRNLPGGDDIFLTQYLEWQRHGPDFSKCPFKCKKCRGEATLGMPFRLEFFLPTVHAASAFEDAVGGGDVAGDGGVSGDAGDQGDGVRGVHVGEGSTA